jgi:muramidase (phage lysozyme)
MSASSHILLHNLNAFLDTISFSEGTNIAGSDDGYNVIVGGTLFPPRYAVPPKCSVYLKSLGITSSAIGRYQVLYDNALFYTKSLNLPDFSPQSQDKIALQLIRECHATQNIINGAIETAITQCTSRWASFPGNRYGQHQQKMDSLLAFFTAAGGVLK